MSDANANQTGEQKPSMVPPPDIPMSSGGGNRLMPTQKLKPRKTVGVAPEITVTDQKDFTPEGYVGQKLVDSKGVIARDQYSEDEAYSELARFSSPAARLNFLKQLEGLGLYGTSKPTPRGFADRDLSAVREAMLVANAEGVTLDVAVSMMAADPTYKKTIPTRRIRTTAKQDLRQVFKSAAGSVLGRQLSDNEVEKFIRSYQQMEVAEQTGGATAPTAQTAAIQAVEAAAPEEAAAMGALTLAELMDRRIKELSQ